MKKLFSLLAMALWIMVSCSDEDVVKGGYVNGIIQATFENEISSSRLIIDDDNALTWAEGDAFVMFGEVAKEWTLDAGTAGQQVGNFSGEVPGEILKGAAFPATLNPTRENGILKMNLPGALDYTEGAVLNLPMWASFSSIEANISFKHLGALLKIDLSNIPEGYNKFIVEADKKISGEFAIDLNIVDIDNGDNQLQFNVVATDVEAERKVEVLFESTGEATKQFFYIPLPVGEYEYIRAYIVGDENNPIRIANWEDRNIVRAKVYWASISKVEIPASTPTAANQAFENLTVVPVAQVALTGTMDATASGAGVIEIPKVEEKATNVTLAFENVPTTNVNAPLVIKEGESETTFTKNNELTIDIPATSASDEGTHLDLDLPSTTVNVTQGTYATITATTASNTLVIGKDVSVGNLIIEAGNVILRGKVTDSIKRSEGNKDELTIIFIEEGAEIANAILEYLSQLEKVIVKYWNEVLLDEAQTKMQEVLNLMVSQIIKNQAQGAEQGMMIARETLADDMTWRTNTWYRNSHLRWECNLDATSKGNLCTWEFYYEIIKRVNEVLETLEKLNPDVLQQEQKDIYNKIKGESLSLRASQHFHLVQLYADRYVSGGGNSQEGIQYRTSTDASKWTVSTVEEVYAYINADLAEACDLLEGVVQETPNHYDEKVAWGLRARVALTMGDYHNAAFYAEKAITLAEAQGKALMTGNQLYNGFADLTTKTQEAMLADVPDKTVYYYSFYSYMSWNRSSTSIRQGVKCINADTYATMSETDLRRAWWDPEGYKEDVAANFIQMPYQNRKFTAHSADDGEGDTPFMRLAEMYLLRAEALARLGNVATAQEVFTKFQQTRDPEYVSKGALLEEIMNSRRVELWGEGFRFYDLKRLHLPIKRGSNFDVAFCGFLEKSADDPGWTFAKPE